jgi:hypothetical protein
MHQSVTGALLTDGPAGWRQLTSRRIIAPSDIIMLLDRAAVERFTNHVDRVLATRGGRRLSDADGLTKDIRGAFSAPDAAHWIVAPTTRDPAT